MEVEKFDKWCMGNVDAVNFLVTLFEISQIADDLADKDIEANPQNVTRLMHKAMVELPLNNFYRQYSHLLLPIFSTSLTIWGNTDRWGKEGGEVYGFVYREVLEQVITMVAFIVGGWEHSNLVTNEVSVYYHRDDESVNKWKNEITGGDHG